MFPGMNVRQPPEDDTEEFNIVGSELMADPQELTGDTVNYVGPRLTPVAEEWVGITTFPPATQEKLHAQLERMKEKGRKQLHLVVLGVNSGGKSSTINTMFGEKLNRINPFAQGTNATYVMRSSSGFNVSYIDMPGLVNGAEVDEAMVDKARATIQAVQLPVDVFLFVDRLDMYRVDSLEKQLIAKLSEKLGDIMWKNTLIVLTHGGATPPEGLAYHVYAEKRIKAIQAAIRQHGGQGSLPAAIVENTSSRPLLNGDNEKILPDGTPIIANLVQKIVDLVTAPGHRSYSVPDKARKDGNKKHRWLIFPLFAFQTLVLYPLLIATLRRDIRKANDFTRVSWGLPPSYIEKEPL